MAMSPAQSIQAAGSSRRVARRPSHTFQLKKQLANTITPFMIAPVLPGETLKSLTMQARAVTDPLVDPLMGWWLEYSFFYVKLRDLTAKATLETMILDPDAGSASLNSAVADWQSYHQNVGAPNWLLQCLEPISREYFRDEGETWNSPANGTLPCAQINNKTLLDSWYKTSEIPNDVTTVGAEDFNDFERRYRMWQMLRQQKMVNMTFEQYLGTYGVEVPNNTVGIPELLRHVRQWTYPSNVVNPTDGNPASAAYWTVAERADKDRFFVEPGFIVGVSVARPKIYMKNQEACGVSTMTEQRLWMPAMLNDDASSSLKEIAAGTGLLKTAMAAHEYCVDVRDLLVHGDQFIDSITGPAFGQVNLPIVGGTHTQSLYAPQADLDALFVTPATANHVLQDGIVNLQILGTQVDMT